ncbi:MAG: hypothetical protein U0P30_08185 [Vicinamibacterales bacterium]
MLIVPGDQFGLDGCLRLGIGEHVGYVLEGLARLQALIGRVTARALTIASSCSGR